MNYKEKYLKYKIKYLQLKQSAGQKDIKIIMFFLAHNGIQKPEFWEKWRGKHNIPFYVCGPIQRKGWIQIPKEFADWEITNWCGPNITYVTIKSYTYILKMNPNLQNKTAIFFATGYDIPIRPATSFLNVQQDIFCLDYAGPYNKSLKNESLETIMKNWVVSQWMILTVQTIKHLLKWFGENYNKLLDVWQKLEKREDVTFMCPDNSFFSTAIIKNEDKIPNLTPNNNKKNELCDSHRMLFSNILKTTIIEEDVCKYCPGYSSFTWVDDMIHTFFNLGHDVILEKKSDLNTAVHTTLSGYNDVSQYPFYWRKISKECSIPDIFYTLISDNPPTWNTLNKNNQLKLIETQIPLNQFKTHKDGYKKYFPVNNSKRKTDSSKWAKLSPEDVQI
jgi:hypothetical protein